MRLVPVKWTLVLLQMSPQLEEMARFSERVIAGYWSFSDLSMVTKGHVLTAIGGSFAQSELRDEG